MVASYPVCDNSFCSSSLLLQFCRSLFPVILFNKGPYYLLRVTQRLSPKTSWTCDLLIIATLLLFSRLFFLGLTTLEISLKLEIKYFCICECIWGYLSNQVRCKIWTTHWHGCCDKAFYCIQGRYDEHSSPLSNQEFLSFVAFLELELLKLPSYMEFLRSLIFIMGLSNDLQALTWQISR